MKLPSRWAPPVAVGLAALAMLCAAPAAADLKAALAEKDLERRSGLALQNAAAALDAARKAYNKGDGKQVEASAAEILDSVNLAFDSLKQTGKNPRKSPKWFKRAEISTREMLRKLDAFQDSMSYGDRPVLEKVKARVREVHDELLVGLLEGKK